MIQHNFTNRAVIYPLTGGYDASGEKLLGAGVETLVGIVGFTLGIRPTNIGTSSAGISASRGSAWEHAGSFRFLLLPGVTVGIGDKLVSEGMEMRVVAKFPRFDVTGQLDHIQIDATPWE